MLFEKHQKTAKIASKMIFSEKIRAPEKHEDDENDFRNFAKILLMKNDESGKNFIKIGEGRFWVNFSCHVGDHMVKPHFFAHFGLKLIVDPG
ncbi:hypothetical protein B9Z55_009851 [Caenorhabditis nigoni]|uniref:Uncharacterized protein n=1 Tax=Caenorhabditis nigoni TaxID=1611254 RepID=A0A2G5UTU8_9PELO|nr:hypothetical protein B9Z55_009851 [Caenorhabditis nigoni]